MGWGLLVYGYVVSRPQQGAGGLLFFVLLLLLHIVEEIFRATKAKKGRYRPGYERWEWKGKVGGEKDKDGVWDGSEAEVDDE